MSEQKPPLPIMPAATVLLLRPKAKGADGFEVFMVVRHHKIDSFSGALVFPGGKLEDADGDPRVRARCVGAEGMTDSELKFRIAGVREAFEECGILLARKRGDADLIAAAELAPIETRWRQKLTDDEANILDLVEAENLELMVGGMVPYAHWITPPMVPKRFDTWFFVASAPVDQVALHDGSESVDSVWIDPAQAVAEADAGKRTMVFPTRQNVLMLAESATVDGAIETSRRRPVVTVLPEMKDIDGQKYLTIPENAGYKITRVLRENA